VIKGVGLISGGAYGATYIFNEKTDDLQNSINLAKSMDNNSLI
jgi:hypothetical protein